MRLPLPLPSLLLAAALSPALTSALPSYDLEARDGGIIARKHSSSGGGKATGGAVATEAAPCSEIGIEILKQGGSAADAIIAAGLCVGTISAYHSGIGGGGFMIVRFNNEDGTHGYEQIDFRETCPGACNATMYAADANGATLSTIGGLAAGVPGELRGWEKLHQRHGKLPWTELFKPAIKIAREGFKVNVDLAYAIKGEEFILNDPLWAEVYAPNGTALVEGDTCYRKRYANTLEKISWYGPDWFYKGEAAVTAAAALYARGGIMTTKDLASYEAVVRETVNITYRDSRIFSTVAPSSGAVVLSALKIFEGYQGNYTDSNPEINVTTHRLLEATQFAYGQRTQYGDPAFTKNVTDLQQYYLTDSVVEELRAKIIDNTTFPVGYYDPSNYTATRESGTSHMAVIDSNGQAVSLTTTVNTYWGSTVMDSSGIIYNNEMDDFGSAGTTNSFGFAASPINYPAAGKRPQSSISSSIAEDLETGEILIATGSAGGSRIITATLQHLYHHLDQSLDAYDCVHHPRWHDQLGGQTLFEWKDESVGIAGYDNSTVAYLSSLGYNTTWQGVSGSTGHVAIRSKNGTLSAANDPRKAAGAGLAY
ncbi:gamma-glutamyltranspeptidase [Leucosporidium creatinivorum]|uniref:Glutathione hydrolase n=1 Tax=Leucosporidium creatinivorum TaxID=106004 RepID=A0A1Y2BXI4_9BASI|nr:gamma-glutamyltranspeptidase [Leucosporidium creatinivorum]